MTTAPNVVKRCPALIAESVTLYKRAIGNTNPLSITAHLHWLWGTVRQAISSHKGRTQVLSPLRCT